MSEEQNDSPAFRLRPRQAAPKSYYTVRLEYSANPAAFIRERPRGGTKRRILSSKSNSSKHLATSAGTQFDKTQQSSHYGSNYPNTSRPAVLTKEEREREERRLMLHRSIEQSITTNTAVSPFMQRLRLDELEPGITYEHNYLMMRIKSIRPNSDSKLMTCRCESTDETDAVSHVTLQLWDEYARPDLIKPGKIINIAKFRTSLDADGDEYSESDSECNKIDHVQDNKHDPGTNNGASIIEKDLRNSTPISVITAKIEPGLTTSKQRSPRIASPNNSHDSSGDSFKMNPPGGIATCKPSPTNVSGENVKKYLERRLLPFHVIIRQEELVERATNNSNRGNRSTSPLQPSISPQSVASVSSTSGNPSVSGSSVCRRTLVPFVSINDMIEKPIEPFVMPSGDFGPQPDSSATTSAPIL